MATESEKEVLSLGVDLKQAIAEMGKWQRAMLKSFNSVNAGVEKLHKTSRETSRESVKSNKEWESSVNDLKGAYREETAAIQKTYDTIAALERQSETASDSQKRNIKENIQLLRKQADAKAAALKARDKKEGFSNASRVLRESKSDVGGDLKKVFEDASLLFSKDLKNSLENGSKFLVKSLKTGAAAAAVKGVGMRSFGAGMAERGKERGGAKGMVLQIAGSGLKQIGGLMSKLGPLIQTLSNMGPAIASLGTAIMGVVKLFLDLDAKAKEFNKDILQSASTAGFLANAGGNADMAWQDVESTLKGLRDSAFSLENLEWGMKPEDHKAIVNVLTQEGIALQNIGEKGKKSSEEIQAFATDLAHVSVAYSRAFGVPLQEINQLQAEMVQDLGIGLSQTKLAFQQVNKSAGEAGVGANKFFSMIRGVSQDLSLWNNRMADAAVLLGKLMKNMSPRTAQNFFQAMQKGLKGMGRTDLLRTTLLNGMKTSMKTVEAEISRNVGGMAENIGRSLGYSDEQVKALADQIKKQGRSAVEPLLDRLDDQTRGAVSEALTRMELMQSRAKKGAYGVGEAMSDLGPVAAAEVKRNIALMFANKKGVKASDMVSAAGEIGVGAMAENQGIDIETYNQIAMMERTMEDQRKLLESRLQDPEVQKKLLKAGIQATQEGISNASWTQLMDTLTEDQKDLINGVSETEKAAKRQAKAQMSFYDRFEVLVDFLMNQVYDVLMGIWDTLLSLPFFGGDEKKRISKLSNLELRKVAGADDASKAMMDSQSWKDLMKGLRDASADPAQGAKFLGAVKDIAKSMGTSNVKEAAKMAGIDQKRIEDYGRASSGKSGNAGDALVKSFKPEELLRIMEKATVWTGSGVSKAEGVEAGLKSLGLDKSLRTPSTTAPVFAAPTPSTIKPQGAPTPSTPAATTDPMLEASNASARAAENNLSLSKDQLQAMQSIDNQMDRLKMDTTFLSGPYSKAMEGSFLKAMRTALFEYYMYKDLDQSSVVSAMQAGALNPGSFSQSFTAASQIGQTGEENLIALQPHATGGLVTGVANGLAQVTAAAGEGLASVGPGERIVPAKGAGSSNAFTINVQGIGGHDLARVIEAKVVDGIHEYKRRERFN